MSVWKTIVKLFCKSRKYTCTEVQTEANIDNEFTQTDSVIQVDTSTQTELLVNQHRDITISSLFEMYKDTYSDFYSDNPKRIYFNKNMFFTLCQTYDFDSMETLKIKLYIENHRKKLVNIYFLNEIQKKKCAKHNFYLFS